MKSIIAGIVYGLFSAAIVCTGSAQSLSTTTKQSPTPEGIGSSRAFLQNYKAFQSNQLRSANPAALVIPLGDVKGHTRSFTSMAGTLNIDLRTGQYTIELHGLTANTFYYVWLIDQDDLGNSAADRAALLASVVAKSENASVSGLLGENLASLSIDKVVVSPDAISPSPALAAGSISVLQKLFFGSVTLTVQGLPVIDSALSAVAPFRFAWLVPNVALQTTLATTVPTSAFSGDIPIDTLIDGAAAAATPVDVLIKQGSTLFFEGRFSGNGRTCGTCHPANNNFTIDPAFIATLPPTDPLFVAENNPALAQLERPALMRQFGLILENLDGLDAPTTKFVMRSVPHTLGMTVSLISDTSQVNPPAQMTGWSGDGAPGTGSLRDFATGAVTQHFTKSLARVPNIDFVLPSPHELDAMEAFQLSLGRNADFDLTKLSFQDANVEHGKSLFLNGTGNPLAAQKCQVCHGNAGALAANGLNRNFNTNVEDRPNPARAVQNFPIDGGFGQTPNPDGSFGNRTFNTPSLIEAAQTPPFFHNNIAPTLEDAVTFYTGPEFNNPRAPAGRFSFTSLEIKQIANFLRGINTLQNIDVATRALNEILALSGNPQPEVQSRLATAFNDTANIIRVLNEGGIYPAAASQVTSAQQLIVQAQQTSNPNQRTPIIQSAITTLTNARPLVAQVVP